MDRRQLLKRLGLSSVAIGFGGHFCLAKGAEKTLPKDNFISPPPYYGEAEVKDGHVVRQRWPYVELDPVAMGDLAYEKFYQGQCMYGVASPILDTLREKVGGPYEPFPSIATLYGSGGVGGWATLCGTLNAVGLITSLVARKPLAVIDELYAFYSYESLPNFFPKNRKFPEMKITSVVADSTLCHVSVSRWCKASGHSAFSAERKERCALLVASVAKKLAEVLNQDANGKIIPAYPIPETLEGCRDCHCFDGEMENSRGKMDCSICHPDKMKKHPQ